MQLMLIFWHTFRSQKSCCFFGTLCILYLTFGGGFVPRISTVQNTKCAKKSTWFFGSKSVPKNQHKLHAINIYICKPWVNGFKTVLRLVRDSSKMGWERVQERAHARSPERQNNVWRPPQWRPQKLQNTFDVVLITNSEICWEFS